MFFSCREFNSKVTVDISNSTNTFCTFYTDSSTNHRFAVFIDYSTGDCFILCQHSAKRKHKCREQKNKFSHRILLLFSDLLLLVLYYKPLGSTIPEEKTTNFTPHIKGIVSTVFFE